jgi:hypothetical protein
MFARRFHVSRRIVRTAIALSIIAVVATRTAAETESECKAKYVLWFAQHVIWRDDDFPAKDSPVVMVILGENPFEPKEIERLKSGPVQRRRIEIRFTDDAETIPVCHILFISKSEKRRLAKALKPFRERRVLTISDIEEFTQEGGVASVVIKQPSGASSSLPVPDINKEAAARGRLEFSPDIYAAVKTLQARYH